VKILALSDKLWPSAHLDQIRKFGPEVVVLAGDVSERGLYSFLKKAGGMARVLVVAGNHDEDSKLYEPARINRIENCEEISGRLVEAAGFRFFGLPFSQAMDDEQLRRLMPTLRKSHVLVTHAPLSRLPKYGWRGPKLIIQGHHGYGVYFGMPTLAVFTDGVHSALIDWPWPLPASVKLIDDDRECVHFSRGKPPPVELLKHYEGSTPCPIPRSKARTRS
jgi:predicted phosphodiesterase